MTLSGKAEQSAVHNRSRPVFSLPHEITADIFGICRDMYHVRLEDNILPSLHASHVSRQWRVVAISTPALWTTLNSIPPRSTLFYEMLVQRSQMLLLDIFIRSEGIANGYVLLTVALLHSHRWRRLNIEASGEFVCSAMSMLRYLSTPHLKELLIGHSPLESSRITPHRILTGGAERLSTFVSATEGRIWCPPLAALDTLVILTNLVVAYSAFCEVLHEVSATLTFISVTIAFEPIAGPLQCIIMPSLLQIEMHTSYGHPTHIFTALATISAPLATHLILVVRSPLQWSQYSELCDRFSPAPAQRYPMLRMLRICGELGGGILKIFRTISILIIIERQPIRNTIGNLFDPNQDGFFDLGSPSITRTHAAIVRK